MSSGWRGEGPREGGHPAQGSSADGEVTGRWGAYARSGCASATSREPSCRTCRSKCRAASGRAARAEQRRRQLTCFYMIVGLIPVDSGRSISTAASSRTIHRRARLGISYLPQGTRCSGASPWRRCAGDPRAGARARRHGARLAELLKDLNIAHLRKHAAIALRRERRRLEIARALGTRPAFILLDEPFAGVDPIAVLDIQRIIGSSRSAASAYAATDHNVRETLGICDRARTLSTRARCSHRATPRRLSIMTAFAEYIWVKISGCS